MSEPKNEPTTKPAEESAPVTSQTKPETESQPTPGSTPVEAAEEAREEADQAEFEAALNAEETRPGLNQGDLVRGKVSAVQQDVVLIALGGKSDAVMDLTELDEAPRVGSEVEAVVISVGAEVRLSARLAADRRAAQQLKKSFDDQVPIEGRVIGRNKGGYHVAVGSLHAFCPLSQIDLGRTEEPDVHLEKTYTFLVIELSDDGRRIVVSRAAHLKAERGEKAAQLRAELKVGSEFDGYVTSIADYGAFVDIGGIEGLVHVSEISHQRVKHPKDVLKQGQQVRVRVIRIDDKAKRVSLSIRELESDPWTEIAGRLAAGATFSGKIVRRTDFGLFVELEPGIEGLVHVSQLPPGSKLDDADLAPGETVNGWVRDVDTRRRRISLALREVATGDPWADARNRYPEGTMVEGQVERVAPFGLFVLLEAGLTGLVPASEIKLKKGEKMEKAYAPGRKLAVTVMSVDTDRKRISLSAEGAKDAVARDEYRKYLSDAADDDGGGLGAMAAALRRANVVKE